MPGYFEIIDRTGEYLAGATVNIKGTSIGAIADGQGKATVKNIPDGGCDFIISFVGFEKKVIPLLFPVDNNRTIEVLLTEGEEIEEIVISATRSSRTIDDIPTRIEAITGEELGEKAAMNSSNIGMLLRETTGVQMQQTSLSSGNMNIRIQAGITPIAQSGHLFRILQTLAQKL